MTIDVLSLFPRGFDGFKDVSIVARAIQKGAVTLNFTDFREFSADKHRKVDDYAYGGFPGLVLQPQPIWDALVHLLEDGFAPVIYFSPQGRPLTQPILEFYAQLPRVILLCGHYKELDQRVRDLAISDELSLGDFVLSGGEIAAMAFIDGVARLQDGVLTDAASARSDSFSDGKTKLGFPCYTRPDTWMGIEVPAVLRNGDHAKIEAWAEERSQAMTHARRPELLTKR
ncbi:MAG TPA: tRNA (guanosine(37)-N1)-methyltransferase TrmD [Candidatus Cloacimonadota bacterium]|nr:tRNA (guanosine(37)-N1)-methyltransferase TrmD [Candidatus Cloacimonadota bacterium]